MISDTKELDWPSRKRNKFVVSLFFREEEKRKNIPIALSLWRDGKFLWECALDSFNRLREKDYSYYYYYIEKLRINRINRWFHMERRFVYYNANYFDFIVPQEDCSLELLKFQKHLDLLFYFFSSSLSSWKDKISEALRSFIFLVFSSFLNR